MIRLPLKRDVTELLKSVESSIVESGGRFSGDESAGSFSGKSVLGEVQGSYRIEGDEIKIDITRKPMLVPMSRIAAEIKSYFT